MVNWGCGLSVWAYCVCAVCWGSLKVYCSNCRHPDAECRLGKQVLSLPLASMICSFLVRCVVVLEIIGLVGGLFGCLLL